MSALAGGLRNALYTCPYCVLMKALICVLSLLLATASCLAAPVNINTANVEQLDQELIGIGPALAQRIVRYRQAHGPFQAPRDIQKVPYIGIKTFQKNQQLILVD